MEEEREFTVGENMLEKYCPVCNQRFNLDEKIVLVPIQKVRSGYGNVVSIPVHSKCRWVENE